MEPKQKDIQAENSQLALSDAGLVQKAKAGNEKACRQIVDRYADTLYRLAYSLAGNSADAADIVQETFSGAFQRIRDFREQASLKTWLTQILVRQAARHHRTQRKFRAVSLSRVEEKTGSPTASVTSRNSTNFDAQMDVMDALEKLSPMHREVLVLREFEGMSYEEIATTLDVPRGTVESRLFRARQELRTQLSDYGTHATESEKG